MSCCVEIRLRRHWSSTHLCCDIERLYFGYSRAISPYFGANFPDFGAVGMHCCHHHQIQISRGIHRDFSSVFWYVRDPFPSLCHPGIAVCDLRVFLRPLPCPFWCVRHSTFARRTIHNHDETFAGDVARHRQRHSCCCH